MKFIEVNNSVVNVDQIIELFLESGGKKRTMLRFKGNADFVEIVNYKYEDLKKLLLTLDQPKDNSEYRYY